MYLACPPNSPSIQLVLAGLYELRFYLLRIHFYLLLSVTIMMIIINVIANNNNNNNNSNNFDEANNSLLSMTLTAKESLTFNSIQSRIMERSRSSINFDYVRVCTTFRCTLHQCSAGKYYKGT